MQIHGWRIIEVIPDSAEPEWLFFSRDPMGAHAITTWSGVANPFEETSIRHWVLRNAPGIPLRLAHCFAWHVTPVP